MDYIRLKKEFVPHLATRKLTEVIAHEYKGDALRRAIRSTRASRNTGRRALLFIDHTLRLLEEHGCRVMGKVVVKPAGHDFDDRRVYGQALRELATTFDSQCAGSRTAGLMILDSRTKVKNEGNVHTITTGRFRAGGDEFPRLLEAPVSGHSDTHVPLQRADVVASAVVFPTACLVYSEANAASPHMSPKYEQLKRHFGSRLQALEHRYVGSDGVNRGGFQVIDPIHQRPTHLLFRD